MGLRVQAFKGLGFRGLGVKGFRLRALILCRFGRLEALDLGYVILQADKGFKGMAALIMPHHMENCNVKW